MVNSFALVRSCAAAMGELCAAQERTGLMQRKVNAGCGGFRSGL